ncbi:uncharacterized protein LOC143359172 [Halictus rubicundus]|uniref:uncharacterized protein LOC143359172 n=1 Tax=Halictus rubicundus TaxID=77578 RepID=UPI004035E7A8
MKNRFYSVTITGCSAAKKIPMDNSTRTSLIEHKEDDDVNVIAVIGKGNDRALAHKHPNKSGPLKHRLQNQHRVTEIGNDQKMTLRKRLDSDPLPSETVHYKGSEMPQKLTAETFAYKQDRKYKDDSDYVKDSTETSSGGSTFGAPTKVRRVHRATRRTRGTREIRRNPIRVTKKDPDKGFSRPRQQLISAKKKETFFDLEPAKRGKSSTMPYMNTRSVTRKMYNVGATYQAPTVRDELEWKEWPVHGMHERPVFHPQVGLAAEYLGRYYTSLDGLAYQEIVDRSEIEVVSVDPRCDFVPPSGEKERNRRMNTTQNSTLKNAKTPVSCKKPKSFKACMHESLHCVLGYCSQVMTPTYKTNVEGKINKLIEKKSPKTIKEPEKPSSTRNTTESTVKYKSSASNRESLHKLIDRNKLSSNYSATMKSQSAKNINQVKKPRLFPAQKVYAANSQKPAVFTTYRTLQTGHLQEIMSSSSNHLVLVNTSEVKDGQILRPLPSNMNLIKLEDSNETLFDIPSVFKNAIPCDDLPESSKMILKQPPVKRGNKVEFTVTKYLLDNSQKNRVIAPKEPNVSENKLPYETTTKEVNAKVMSDNLNKTWCATDASEIAKILSEYNKSSTKKPAIENQGFYANLKNIRIKEVSNKENNSLKQPVQDSSLMRNMNIKFPQGKLRRFHLTVEKLKDMKSSSNERKTVTVSNRQSIFKIDHAAVDPAPESHPENFKFLELSQSTKLEKKENNSMTMVNESAMKTQSLQELLGNTAVLYCAATGTHQDDLAYYVDSLDAAQSIQWLETCKNVTF